MKKNRTKNDSRGADILDEFLRGRLAIRLLARIEKFWQKTSRQEKIEGKALLLTTSS